MPGDWRRLCRGKDLHVDGARVRVEFDNGRSHVVRVHETPDGYVATAVVASAAVTAALPDPVFDAWLRNRRSRLAGYRVDDAGRLVAHAWTPRVGLNRDAFQALIRAVAREADRYEFLLTGTDRH